MSTTLRHFAETAAPDESLTPLGHTCLSLLLIALALRLVLAERFAAGAHLARCVRNGRPWRMFTSTVQELARGWSELLFPEETRTFESPITPLKANAVIGAAHTTAPVQTPIMGQGGTFRSDRWSLLQHPSLPITCWVRLGRRVEPAQGSRGLTDGTCRHVCGRFAAAPQYQWLGNRGAPRPER